MSVENYNVASASPGIKCTVPEPAGSFNPKYPVVVKCIGLDKLLLVKVNSVDFPKQFMEIMNYFS